jgi:hypothetical protein
MLSEIEQDGAVPSTADQGVELFEQMNGLIQEINERIGQDDGAGAIAGYKKLQEIYQELPRELKARAYKKCAGLYKTVMTVQMFMEQENE